MEWRECIWPLPASEHPEDRAQCLLFYPKAEMYVRCYWDAKIRDWRLAEDVMHIVSGDQPSDWMLLERPAVRRGGEP